MVIAPLFFPIDKCEPFPKVAFPNLTWHWIETIHFQHKMPLVCFVGVLFFFLPLPCNNNSGIPKRVPRTRILEPQLGKYSWTLFEGGSVCLICWLCLQTDQHRFSASLIALIICVVYNWSETSAKHCILHVPLRLLHLFSERGDKNYTAEDKTQTEGLAMLQF